MDRMTAHAIGCFEFRLQPENQHLFLSFFLPVRLNLRGGHQTGFGLQVLNVVAVVVRGGVGWGRGFS